MDLNTVKFRELEVGEFFVRVGQLPGGVVVLYKKTAGGGYAPIMLGLGPVGEEEEVIRVLVTPPTLF